jgi:hypothetical protein
MKREKFIRRISVGLTEHELEVFDQALRVWYLARNREIFDALTTRERGSLIRKSIWAFCSAVVRQQASFTLACDVRTETRAEIAQRLGEPIPANGTNRLKKYLDGGFN